MGSILRAYSLRESIVVSQWLSLLMTQRLDGFICQKKILDFRVHLEERDYIETSSRFRKRAC